MSTHKQARRIVARAAKELARQHPGNPTDRVLEALASLDARVAALEAAAPAAAVDPDSEVVPNDG